MITQNELKQMLDYDPITGQFTWAVPNEGATSVKIGKIAGHTNKISGYHQICVNGKLYQSHRLAWLYVYGSFPSKNIDHINGVRDDNRIDNLREANYIENGQNRSINKNNTSGFIGVSYHKKQCKWTSRITFNYKIMNLGYFDTAEEAHQAYVKAKSELHTFNPTIRELT
jgi:hypothetical protein